MKKVIVLTLIFIFIIPLHGISGELESWKGEIEIIDEIIIDNDFVIDGSSNNPTSIIFIKGLDIGNVEVIDVTEDTVLHLPRDAKVIAIKPKIYNEKKFSDEMRTHLILNNIIIYSLAFLFLRAASR